VQLQIHQHDIRVERPHLLYRLWAILCFADDLNGDSAGWMGGTAIPTPALDALAAESHRFVNAHVTAPICQPSRAALLTGRVPHRSGAMGFVTMTYATDAVANRGT